MGYKPGCLQSEGWQDSQVQGEDESEGLASYVCWKKGWGPEFLSPGEEGLGTWTPESRGEKGLGA